MHNVLPLRFRRDDPLVGVVSEPAMHEPVADPYVERTVDPAGALREAREARPEVERVADPRPPTITVDAVDLGSLSSIAVRVGVVVLGIGALGVAALWALASSAGVLARAESFMQSIGFRNFDISTSTVAFGLVLIVASLALMTATVIVLMGAAYNLLAARGRGLRVRVTVPAPWADA